MGMIVRLPLQGNLDNKGTANVTVTVSGTTSYADGRKGQALSCNGSSFWNIVGVTLGTEASIAYWSKTSTANKMPWVIVATSNSSLNLYYTGSGYCLNTGDGSYNLFKNDSGTAVTTLTDNQWHHFVVTFGNSEAKLYIDGVYRGKATTFKSPATTSANTIRLAGGYGGGHSYDFNGMISDFRVYDYCLNEAEVRSHLVDGKGLQIWLPLNGDLTQQGLSNATITNVGATVDSSGKIGKCYSFDGSDDGIRIDGDILPQLQKSDFTIAFWAYSNDSGDRSIYIATTPASNWGFSIEKTTSEKLRVYWQNSPDFNTTTFNVPNQEWFHVAVVINNGNCYCYKNGEKVAERTNGDMTPAKLTRTWVYAQLGRDTRTGTTVLNGKMNDFRWYDYALSEKEVKELSKGLVLHYLLNRGGLGQENLAREANSTGATSNFGSSPELKTVTFSGWDDYCKQNLDLTATEWNNLVGTKITYRLWLENIEQTTGTGTGIMIHFRYADGTYQQFGGGKNGAIGSWLAQGESGWVWLTVTVPDPTIRSTPTTINNVQYSIRHNSNNGVSTVRYKCAKVEKGSIATPWCPNSSDTLATTMGLNSTTEYDCSGFGNNGIQNNLPTYSSDTVKHYVSTHLDGVNQTIQLPNLLTLIPDSIFTFNIWFKRLQSEPSSKPWETILGGPSGFELESCSANNVHDAKIKAYSWGGGNFAFEFDKWNMLTMVSNGTNALFYLNGELKLTGTYKALVSGNYFLGSWRDTSTQNYKGYMSDARIYATALSADDIAELYNGGVL